MQRCSSAYLEAATNLTAHAPTGIGVQPACPAGPYLRAPKQNNPPTSRMYGPPPPHPTPLSTPIAPSQRKAGGHLFLSEETLASPSGYQAKDHNFIAVSQYLGLTASASCDHGSMFINTSSLICFIISNSIFPSTIPASESSLS